MKNTLHPAIDVETWSVGDNIKCLEEDVIGTVIEARENFVTIRWADGMKSNIGRRSNVAGRFEKVC